MKKYNVRNAKSNQDPFNHLLVSQPAIEAFPLIIADSEIQSTVSIT